MAPQTKRWLTALGFLAVASGKVYFSERFGPGWEDRWTVSELKASEGTQGKWTTGTGKWFVDEAEDRGVMTSEDSKFYGLSAGFEPFNNEGKDLIIQYSVKYEQDLECGGGYVKVGPKPYDAKKFGEGTVYYIMFGPDGCGFNKRTHLILRHRGAYVLKKTDLLYIQDDIGVSNLYRLIIRPNNTARVEVNGAEIYDGDLKQDWELLGAKFIKDPEDKKPANWVDDTLIVDKDDKKPADWVDVKRIRDTAAKKPSTWDDDEDGEWEPPMKDNPDYKGEWHPRTIDNPAYKGYWEARKIPNPNYVDEDVYKFTDIGFIGFDLWQVKSGSIFDNVIITDSVAEADAFAEKWHALADFEHARKKELDDAKRAERKRLEEERRRQEDEEADDKLDDET